MHTVERVADNAVFGSVALNHVEQRAAFAMRHIAQRNLLFSGGNLLINPLKNRYQFIDKCLAFLVQFLSVYGHLLFPNLEHGEVGFLFHPQERIPLLQRLVVA